MSKKPVTLALVYVTPDTANYLAARGAASVVDTFLYDPENAKTRVKYWLRDPEQVPHDLKRFRWAIARRVVSLLNKVMKK